MLPLQRTLLQNFLLSFIPPLVSSIAFKDFGGPGRKYYLSDNMISTFTRAVSGLEKFCLWAESAFIVCEMEAVWCGEDKGFRFCGRRK